MRDGTADNKFHSGEKSAFHTKTWIRRAAAAFLVLLFAVAFYNRVVVRYYLVETEKFSAEDSLRFVLVTDLHSRIYQDGILSSEEASQGRLARRILAEKPDAVFLCGDIGDDVNPMSGALLLVRALRKIRPELPLYYADGNHEYKSGEIGAFKRELTRMGVLVLENSCARVEIRGIPVVIAGSVDPEAEKAGKQDDGGASASLEDGDVQEAFEGLADVEAYRILLAHRPEKVDLYDLLPFDLVLSGHAHGGQVRIPFLLNGIYAPNQGWFPKYAGGRYERMHEEGMGGYVHIVSRGVSVNPKRLRMFNPPELVLVELRGSR